MLQSAYKEAALIKTQVYRWFSRFKQGITFTDNQPSSGRPSTSQTEEIMAKICQATYHCRRTIDELVQFIGVSWNSCQQIL